ncbi:MAG TPA: S28 family serine protease [Pseudonocardiaceae bacterium]|jgi:hypothetical protein|nr:S28 family serine protease [Pseudonocardiaceae bacterium]
MRSRFVVALLLFAALLAPLPAVAAPTTDIVTLLHQIPNVTYLAEDPSPPSGFREFSLEYKQLIDHRNPGLGTFEQQVTLLHKDVNAPMVVFTSGYFNYETIGFTYITEPTMLTGANQLDIEHRFFGNSLPQPTFTSNLSIWQEATDEHVIDNAFKHIYQKHWLATGVSKGGMTAVFHDRFYPNDYYGTLAVSSPDDITDRGNAYINFLNNDGTPQCVADLHRVQIEALQQRAPMEALMQQAADAAGATFDDIGSLDEAYEFDVILTPFAFWQFYNNQIQSCATIPPVGASVQDLYNFFDTAGGTGPGGMLAASDQGNGLFLPYYYQAGTQLDYPVEPQSYLAGLLHFPNAESARAYVPRSIPMRFDPTAMPDIDHWVKTQGAHLIFTYGSLDPYSATPFRLGPGTRDSFVYDKPGGDHLTLIASLTPAQQQQITSTLRRWAGEPANANGSATVAQAANAKTLANVLARHGLFG